MGKMWEMEGSQEDIYEQEHRDKTILRNMRYDFQNEIGKKMRFVSKDGEEHNVVIMSVGLESYIDENGDVVTSMAVVDLEDNELYDMGIGYMREFEVSEEHYDIDGLVGKWGKPIGGFDLHDLHEGVYYQILAVAEVKDGIKIVTVPDASGYQTLPLSDLEIKE